MSPPAASIPAIDEATPPAGNSGRTRFVHVRRWWPHVAAVLSGVLLALCYPRFDNGWLVWTALTPLICATWFRTSLGPVAWWKRALHDLAPGYVAGLVFFSITFNFLGSLAGLYGNKLLLSLPFLLSLLFGLYIGLWTWFLGFLVPSTEGRRFAKSGRNLVTAAIGASVWLVLEWTRGWLFGGFGWNGLGVALHRDLAMIQIADLTGVWGLTWLIVYVNLISVIVIRRIIGELGPTFLRKMRWEFSLSVGLVVAVFSYGVQALIRGDVGPTIPLRVAAIQPNIPQVEKFDPQFETKVLETLGRLTALATLSDPPPQLVVWPEATTPRPLYADEGTYRFVLEQSKREGMGLLFGSIDFDEQKGEDYNVAALFTDSGKTQQIYRKIHLVTFGEYLPLRPIFGSLLGDLVPGDFTPGREYKVLHLQEPKVDLAALVCFEDTVGDLTRRFVGGGAQLLVNITNDGWFGTSPAAEQQLANSLFRCIETRRPLLRCGNTGVTGSIDPFGRLARFDRPPNSPVPRDVVAFVPPFEEGFVIGSLAVPTERRLTFYTRHGDWLPHVCIAISALALLRGFATRRLKRASP